MLISVDKKLSLGIEKNLQTNFVDNINKFMSLER